VTTPTPTRDVFLASLNRCLAEPGFVAGFYERFLGSSREVREKFRGTNMERQFRVLADSLYIVANAVQGEEGSVARSELPRLAERHDRHHMDVGPHLYGHWTDCLIATAKATDPQFDDVVEAAWRETLAFGVRFLTERY
jgi:hemoglobin-like flavoprotein